MATTGLVQRLEWSDSNTLISISIGPSPASTDTLFIQFRAADPVRVRNYKKSMVYLLTRAQAAGYEVTLIHPANSTEVTYVTFGGFNICPIGAAVHNDFYAVSGSGIPDNAEIVFNSESVTVTVTPDLVRPHWVFLAELPAAIPVGRNTVQLQAPGWSSDAVPIDVSGSPLATVRVLYSGAPKSQPYTIAFVANPAIEAEAGGSFSADPILNNRPGFHDAVGYCLQNLLTVTEELLRQNDIDAYIRFVAIFDSTLGSSEANSLAHEWPNSNIMETRRNKLKPFLARYSEVADVVFVVHGSTTHDRASAWYTTDANTPTTAYTYDGVNRVHGHLPSIPGSAAVPINMNQTGLTPIHEFGHAASDFNNGRVNDLYSDGGVGGFVVNKKARSNAGDPIPNDFGSYNGNNYSSDQNRDGLSYPNTWTSYHPGLIDPARPNMMDNYWLTANPQRCRLDQLTYGWFTDRLRAKIFR